MPVIYNSIEDDDIPNVEVNDADGIHNIINNMVIGDVNPNSGTDVFQMYNGENTFFIKKLGEDNYQLSTPNIRHSQPVLLTHDVLFNRLSDAFFPVHGGMRRRRKSRRYKYKKSINRHKRGHSKRRHSNRRRY